MKNGLRLSGTACNSCTMDERMMAFQCNGCKAVFPAEIAGDNDLPHACPICGRGVKFEVNETGTNVTKLLDPDNWIKLADLTPEELEEGFHLHGLKPANVTAHKGAKPLTGMRIVGQNIQRVAAEDMATSDKGAAE